MVVVFLICVRFDLDLSILFCAFVAVRLEFLAVFTAGVHGLSLGALPLTASSVAGCCHPGSLPRFSPSWDPISQVASRQFAVRP
jgi:hypothetical protein